MAGVFRRHALDFGPQGGKDIVIRKVEARERPHENFQLLFRIGALIQIQPPLLFEVAQSPHRRHAFAHDRDAQFFGKFLAGCEQARHARGVLWRRQFHAWEFTRRGRP